MSENTSSTEPTHPVVVESKPRKKWTSRSNVVQKLKKRRQEAFLNKLSETGSVTQSAAYAGINLCTPYNWCEVDLDFQRAMESARAVGEKVLLATLEEEIERRAMSGKGDPGSAILLMFKTKKLDPTYRENPQVHVNMIGPASISLGVGGLSTPEP